MTNTAERTVEIDILIAKIEKMWRRANHPNTPQAEREVAEAKALSLMEQHRISKAMLDIDETDELDDHFYGTVTGSYGRINIDFINAIALAYDCKVYWKNWGMKYDVYLMGFRSDADRVKALATFLLSDATNQARKFKSWSRAITLDYRRSFLDSYRWEISARLRQAATIARESVTDDAEVSFDGNHSAASAAVKGAELVLVARKERVDAHYKSKKFRAASSRSVGYNAQGSADGRIAGQNVNLSGKRSVSSGTKALAR